MNHATKRNPYILAALLFAACGDDGIIVEGGGLEGVPEFAIFATATITPQMLAENPWLEPPRTDGFLHVATFETPKSAACEILGVANGSEHRWTELVTGGGFRIPTGTFGVFSAPAERGSVPTEQFWLSIIAHDSSRTRGVIGQTTIDYAFAECQSSDDFDCLRTVTCGDGRPCISGVFPTAEVALDAAFACD